MGWRHVIGLGAPASKRMASLMTRQNIANMAAWQWEHTKLWNNTPFIQYEMLWIYVCICVYIYIQTHTHTYIYIYKHYKHNYIHLLLCVYIYMVGTSNLDTWNGHWSGSLWGSCRFTVFRVRCLRLQGGIWAMARVRRGTVWRMGSWFTGGMSVRFKHV